MHPIQSALLDLSKKSNLAQLSLREMATAIDLPKESPQKIKHHLIQLQKKGFLTINRSKGMMEVNKLISSNSGGLLKSSSQLFSIPIVGMANAGPANVFAEQNFQGFLRISSRLLGRKKPTGLYAVKIDGSSMNRAVINGKAIEDRDIVVVDSTYKNPSTNDVVLAIVDNKATIKRFINDQKNKQIVLKADSSFDYEPIHLHPDDDLVISGKVIEVVKKPDRTR